MQITNNIIEREVIKESCCICLEESDTTNLIEYNHCGKYYIHNSCLNIWNSNDCIICRQSYREIIEPTQNNNNRDPSGSQSSVESDSVSILVDNRTTNSDMNQILGVNKYQVFVSCLIINIFGIGLMLLLMYAEDKEYNNNNNN